MCCACCWFFRLLQAPFRVGPPPCTLFLNTVSGTGWLGFICMFPFLVEDTTTG